jgi:hypothetical protein
MKTFTGLILAIGIIMLVIYAINPLEGFTVGTNPATIACIPDPVRPGQQICGLVSSSTTINEERKIEQQNTNENIRKAVEAWRKLSPDEKIRLTEDVRRKQLELGLIDSGVFSVGTRPLSPSSSSNNRDGSGNRSTDKDREKETAREKEAMNQFLLSYLKQERSPSQVQGTKQTMNQRELCKQPVRDFASCKSLDNRYNEAKKAENDYKKKFAQLNRKETRMKKMAEEQSMYARKQAEAKMRCPQPDANVWIKRNEIPCWACKV